MSVLGLVTDLHRFKNKKQKSQGIALLNPDDAEIVMFDDYEQQIINMRIISDQDYTVTTMTGKSSITREYADIYKKFMLETNIGLEHISMVELFANGNPIVACTNEVLVATQTLTGEIDIPRGMIRLPFPEVKSYRIRDLWIRITCNVTRQKNTIIRSRATDMIAEYFPKPLASIVSEYLGGSLSGYVSIYGMYQYVHRGQDPLIDENVEITQFQSHVQYIAANANSVKARLKFTHSVRRYIIYFVDTCEPLIPLDILQSGQLILNGQVVHSKFTRRMLLNADKFLTGVAIPRTRDAISMVRDSSSDIAIYTMTFDPQKDILNAETYSLLNSTRIDWISLEVNIEPQKMDVRMIVVAEGYNFIKYSGYEVAVAYSW